MTPSLPSHTFENSEILDLHIDGKSANVVVITHKKLRILDLAKGKIRWAVEEIKIGSVPCVFRAARFGAGESKGILFVVVNSSTKKQSYIQKYDTSNWKVKSSVQVNPKPITAFSIRFG